MQTRTKLIISGSLLAAYGAIAVVENLRSRKLDREAEKRIEERRKRHKQILKSLDALNDELGNRIENAKYWEIVTRPEEGNS